MILTLLALILIPLGLGAVLCVCGVRLVGALTAPQRNTRKLVFVVVGACGLGAVGFFAAGIASFAWGFIPIFGWDKGNQPAVALAMFGGMLLFGCAGAWLGAVLARHSAPTPAPDAR